ncbi:MAG: haloacid dehalogenase-like hydrolase [Planctomycetaceae bacterium]|jgi:phosphoglycolate phosphatase-like HAD superfamily hydrolase|nr:haloacid dehalogenase-like hydrolase [Planctomycetaceae bacterium]
MSSIEIVHGEHPVVCPKAAMLDFDGTLSVIRAGWHPILIGLFLKYLRDTPQGKLRSETELEEVAKSHIELQIGQQPIYQFYSLVQVIREFGGIPSEPEDYLREYYQFLFEIVRRRHDQIRNGVDPQEFVVPGTYGLLAMLQRRGLKLYLVSGTEEELVREDVRLLRLSDYFDGGIYGGQKTPSSFSKALLVDRILRENQLTGAELLGFGDGHTETCEVKKVGGFAIGVASNETARSGIDLWKRDQLLRAGADWIIPDYNDLATIESKLFELP